MLAACAGTPGTAPGPADPGAPILLLPLRNRGGLAAAAVVRAEESLRAAVRRAGRNPVAAPAPTCPEEPCPPVRAVHGDEPDPLLAEYAGAAGAPSLLAGWVASLPDGSIAWALRLVDAPSAGPDPETTAAISPNPGAPAPAATRAANAAEPAAAAPAGTAPAGAGESAPGGSPETLAPLPGPRPLPRPARTVDRAGGLAPDPQTLARELATAAGRLLAGPPAPSPRGQRTAGDLARRLRARAGLFDACLAERLLATPGLAGAAVLQIVVDVRGQVRDVRFAGSSFADPILEACLADAAAQIDFPAGVGGTSVLEQRLLWPRPVAAAP